MSDRAWTPRIEQVRLLMRGVAAGDAGFDVEPEARQTFWPLAFRNLFVFEETPDYEDGERGTRRRRVHACITTKGREILEEYNRKLEEKTG